MTAPTDLVYLTVEPDGDRELVRRDELPDDAYRAALDIDGEHVDGGQAGVTYEVFVVER